MALADDLKTLLADAVTFYFQAHGCHWNVEGQDFSQYHGLFEAIYEDVYSSIDPIAENIRKLDEYAPFNLARLIDLRTIEFDDVRTDPRDMAAYLRDANDSMISSIARSFSSAMEEDEQGIANFLAERDDMHKKWRWQLKSSLK